jgi:hypothetical protein
MKGGTNARVAFGRPEDDKPMETAQSHEDNSLNIV